MALTQHKEDLPGEPSLEQKKTLASGWFRELRDTICAEFETIETELGGRFSDLPPGRFERKRWEREEAEPAVRKEGGRGQETERAISSRSDASSEMQEAFRGGEDRKRGQETERAISSRSDASSEMQEHFAEANIKTPGGGEMSIMRGRVFEKVGVNISTVQGVFSEEFRSQIPGADKNPNFWASGISLVAHMRSPLVPAVHMNTRMIVVGGENSEFRVQSSEEKENKKPPNSDHRTLNSARIWFGGGADLTPTYPDAEDTAFFHAQLKVACDDTDPGYYPRFKQWCDEYFYLKHRQEPRGVGGIFYDYLDTEWEKHFAFTQAVGRAFLAAYPPLVRKSMDKPWTAEQREQQRIKRGRYVEFNLLYDRGTKFGLMTGGNTEAILMSLPPEVTWP